MAKNFLEKRDLKAITTLSLYSNIKGLKEKGFIGEDDKIIFITSFGIVTASDIISGPFEEEKLNQENFARFTMQTAVQNSKNLLIENENEDILDTQTSFILEDVTIHLGDSSTSLPIMILFAEDIAGISFGDRR